jgi:hypothetical protein
MLTALLWPALGFEMKSFGWPPSLGSAGRSLLNMKGATMVYSVAALPFAHVAAPHEFLSWVVMGIGVIAFTACLVLYGVVIKAALDQQ